MDRHQFNEEDRDGLVGQLTAQRVRSWSLLLQAGDKRATSDLHNLVLDRLAEDDAKALFVGAALDPDAAGALFVDLVAKLMHDRCETDAEKAVDAMEQGRKESHDDNRIAQALAARMH